MSTLEAATGRATVTDLASGFQRNLVNGDADSNRVMNRAWGQIGAQTERDAAALANQMAEYRAANPGQPIPNGWLYKQRRYRDLMANVQQGLTSTAPDMTDAIERDQMRGALLAGDDAAALVDAATGTPGLAANFTVVRPEVIESFVGFLQNGSPIADLVGSLGIAHATEVNGVLLNAVANGWGPDRIARQLRRVTGISASRASTIARTEAMRLYRYVSHATYLENADVLSGWVWHSRRDMRCCSTCWAMGGSLHQLDEQLDGHPNCRCIMVPMTQPWGISGTKDTSAKASDSEKAFRKLSPAQRRQILGPGKAKLYESGEINLSDLVKREDNGPWGTMRRQASIGDAKAHAKARKLGKGAPGEDESWRLGGTHGVKQPSKAAQRSNPAKVRDVPTKQPDADLPWWYKATLVGGSVQRVGPFKSKRGALQSRTLKLKVTSTDVTYGQPYQSAP